MRNRLSLVALAALCLAGCASWTPEQLRARGQRADLQLSGDYRAGATCIARIIDRQPGYSSEATWDESARTAEVRGRGWGSETAILVQVVDAPAGPVARVYTRGDSQNVRTWFHSCAA